MTLNKIFLTLNLFKLLSLGTLYMCWIVTYKMMLISFGDKLINCCYSRVWKIFCMRFVHLLKKVLVDYKFRKSSKPT